MYRYKDYHLLTVLSFPETERAKIVGVEGSIPVVWLCKEPLQEETIKKLELKEIN